MRMMLTAVLTIVSTSTAMALPPDPYRYCADRVDGSTNCYFLTLEQCQQSAGRGSCRENLFYNPAPGKASPARPRGRRR